MNKFFSAEPITLNESLGTTSAVSSKTAILAGGCFWCVEADLEKVPGAISVESGYAGGSNENPTYQNYAQYGHREVVRVTYDDTITNYGALVEYLIKHIDPTDPDGSFYDRGGKRFCMNSAALRFVAQADMEEEGYGDYLVFVE